jgi:hypothetical protein
MHRIRLLFIYIFFTSEIIMNASFLIFLHRDRTSALRSLSKIKSKNVVLYAEHLANENNGL